MFVGAIVLLIALLLPIDAVAFAQASPPTNPEAGELLAAPNEAGPYSVGSTLRCLNRPLDGSETRPVSTVIWYPADARPGQAVTSGESRAEALPERRHAPYPVFLWSHGNQHEPTASSFLAKHLASHGIVVVAPSHVGVPHKGCPSSAGDRRASQELDDSSRERPDDAAHALEYLLEISGNQEKLLNGMLDRERVAVGGHSRGAGTAVRVASSHPRLKAVVIMAPPAFDAIRSFSEHPSAPTMLMGGEVDRTTPYAGQLELFDLLKSANTSHWFLTLRRAGHSAFTDECPADEVGCGPDGLPQPRAHELIKRWTTTFLLHHLVGRTQYAALLDPQRDSQESDARLLSARSLSTGQP